LVGLNTHSFYRPIHPAGVKTMYKHSTSIALPPLIHGIWNAANLTAINFGRSLLTDQGLRLSIAFRNRRLNACQNASRVAGLRMEP